VRDAVAVQVLQPQQQLARVGPHHHLIQRAEAGQQLPHAAARGVLQKDGQQQRLALLVAFLAVRVGAEVAHDVGVVAAGQHGNLALDGLREGERGRSGPGPGVAGGGVIARI
jgi:hypothetical protein